MGIYKHRLKFQGFTLLELMVTVAIAAILAAMAMPSFTQTIRNNRLTTTNNMLLTSLNLARSEAIKRGVPVTVRKVDNNSFTSLGAGANWENGWDVFTDIDSDGIYDAVDGDSLINTFQSVPVNYTLRGTVPGFTNRVTFQPTGLSGNGSFVLCDNFDGDNLPQANTARMIIISITGRAMTAGDIDNDGIPNKNDGTEIVSCTVSPF